MANETAQEMKAVKRKELWTYVKGKTDDGLKNRRSFEGQWILNLAFLAGRQYTKFSSSLHALQTVKNPKGMRRRVDNILIPRWNRQVADYIRTKPQFSVVPMSAEDEDIEGAKAGTKVFKHFYRANRMAKKTRVLGGWVHACGNGFLSDRWNPKLGPMEMGEDGELRYLGDADCEVWSPFEIIVPNGFAGDFSIHDFPWMIKIKWRNLEWITNNYKDGHLVMSETQSTPVYNITGLFSAAGGSVTPESEDGAYVIEYYEKPNKKHKSGRFVTCANTIILNEDTWPFDHYAIEQFKDIDLPGVFWGKATLEDAIPLQVRWNNVSNNIDEAIRVMGKGKWLVPEGSGFKIVNDQHGEVIRYTPVMGHIPQHLTLKGLPNSYAMALQIITQSMNNIFSQHEVSQGTNKSDIRSGEMVALLQEQDSYGKIPSHMVFEEAFEAVGSRILKRIQAGYTEQRMIQTIGRDGEFEVMAFKGADLRNNTDLCVKTQSSLPDSRIARQAIIQQRWQQGMYGNPADPEVQRKVSEALDDALIEPMYSKIRKDEGVAMWENRILVTARQRLDANTYDNHRAHKVTHDDFRKSRDYQKIKIANPNVFTKLEQFFINHTVQHEKAIAKEEEQMMKMLMMKEKIGKGGEAQ